MGTYHVYLMASHGRTIYIGVTTQLETRVLQHQQKSLGGFTRKYNVVKLVYFEALGDIRAAIRREKELKGWLRSKKIALIESTNPEWKDLSEDWSRKSPPVAARRGQSKVSS